MWHPERRIDFWISTSSYPSFKHKSFNFRVGKASITGGDTKEAAELQKKKTAEYQATHPNWIFDPHGDTGPTVLPSHWIVPRSIEVSIHVKYGKQLFGIRSEIDWNRKQRRDLRP